MFLRQITDNSLAQNAYLIGCQRTGGAIVSDPERDVDRYLKLAADNQNKNHPPNPMNKIKIYFWPILVVALCMTTATQLKAAEPAPATIPLQVRENIRVVYQVSDDAQHEGLNKGLFYARKLLNTYGKQGIARDQVHLHLVYHGTAIAALANAEARKRLGADKPENRNAGILTELARMGVQIEICEDTMRQKKVTAAELMPEVKIVVGAFPRLIDLQLQGVAYIKFE